jgi:hypothetical protein
MAEMLEGKVVLVTGAGAASAARVPDAANLLHRNTAKSSQ